LGRKTGRRGSEERSEDAARTLRRKEKTHMPHIEIEILAPFAAKYLEGTTLTPAERAEVLRLAQGFACKDSAAAASVSPETIRARRKRIYRKLDVPGSGEIISQLLALSLRMLANGERVEPRPVGSTQQQADPHAAPSVAAAR
jgi:DNA-binding CsgD family transcriptional regulator